MIRLASFASAAVAAILTAACSPDVSGPQGGASPTGGTVSAASSGGGDGGGQASGCSSPDGFRICGGKEHCSADPKACPACVTDRDGSVALCHNDAYAQLALDGCGNCLDGEVCFYDDFGYCAPFEVGELFARAGGRAGYADLSEWTGKPLPEPDSCPTFDGFQICGGHCGGCPSDRFCTGRSPLHPYGLCMPNDSFTLCIDPNPCAKGRSCFRFAAPARFETQLAYCLDTAECEAAAAMIPGGGECAPHY